MAWLEFVDQRPAYRFAIKCGNRNWHFLFKHYPDDAMQCVSVAVTRYPDIGKPLVACVARELGRLATELGWRRMPTSTKQRPWRNVTHEVTFDSMRAFNGETGHTVFATAPRCGTLSSYRCGCRCDKCRDNYKKNRWRAKSK